MAYSAVVFRIFLFIYFHSIIADYNADSIQFLYLIYFVNLLRLLHCWSQHSAGDDLFDINLASIYVLALNRNNTKKKCVCVCVHCISCIPLLYSFPSLSPTAHIYLIHSSSSSHSLTQNWKGAKHLFLALKCWCMVLSLEANKSGSGINIL